MAHRNFDVIAESFLEVKSYRHLAGAAMGMLAVMVAVDRGLTAREQRNFSSESQLILDKNRGEQTTILLPGCRSDGRVIADMLRPKFSEMGDVAAVTYPEKGFSIDSVRNNLLEARHATGNKPVSLYAISMGGLVLSRLFADEEFSEEFGKIETVVLDSSPSGVDDIRKSARFAMEITKNRAISDSWLATKIASEAMVRRSGKYVDHEDCVSDEQVLRHFETTAKTPLYVAREQGEFIKKTQLAPGSLEGMAKNAYYVRSHYDSVVDTEHALSSYNEAFGYDIQDVVDEARPYGSHAAGPEYQNKLIELLDQSQDRSMLAVA